MDTQASPANAEGRGYMATPLSTLALFAAFSCWTLLVVVGLQLKGTWHFNEAEFAALLVLPLPLGGLCALAMGALAARYGGRRIQLYALSGLLLVLVGLLVSDAKWALILAGLGFGLGGAVFSGGLQYVVQNSPTASRDRNLGIFLAGTLGASFSYLVTPLVHSAYDWQVAPVAYIAITLFSLTFIGILTEPEPKVPWPADDAAPAPTVAAPEFGSQRWFRSSGLLFGTLFSLMLWLPGYISGHYGYGPSQGAFMSLAFLFPATLGQYLGCMLSARFGAKPLQGVAGWTLTGVLLLLSLAPAAALVGRLEGPLDLSLSPPPGGFILLTLVLGTFLGLSSGSLMREAARHFGRRIGLVGGGMMLCGCFAAIALTLMFGITDDLLGYRGAGFMVLFALFLTWSWNGRRLRPAARQPSANEDLSPKG